MDGSMGVGGVDRRHRRPSIPSLKLKPLSPPTVLLHPFCPRQILPHPFPPITPPTQTHPQNTKHTTNTKTGLRGEPPREAVLPLRHRGGHRRDGRLLLLDAEARAPGGERDDGADVNLMGADWGSSCVLGKAGGWFRVLWW